MSYHPYRLTSAPWGRVPQTAPLTRNDLLLVEPVSSHLGESSLIWTRAEISYRHHCVFICLACESQKLTGEIYCLYRVCVVQFRWRFGKTRAGPFESTMAEDAPFGEGYTWCQRNYKTHSVACFFITPQCHTRWPLNPLDKLNKWFNIQCFISHAATKF